MKNYALFNVGDRVVIPRLGGRSIVHLIKEIVPVPIDQCVCQYHGKYRDPDHAPDCDRQSILEAVGHPQWVVVYWKGEKRRFSGSLVYPAP